jgi:hypothetical protein
MRELTVLVFVLAVGLYGMRIYIKSHPPQASPKGVFWLHRGLRLGAVSSTVLLFLYIGVLYFVPTSPSLFWPLMLPAIGGSVLNLASLIYCLRERNGKSVFAAILVLLNQLLWILYAIRSMPDF